MDNKEILLLADQLNATKEAKAEVDKRSKELGAKIEELDRALSDAMAEVELDNFTHSGYTFYLKSRLFASPISGKKDALMDALKGNGFGSLVVETVNSNTLSSFIKEQMAENDDEIPEWLKENVNTFEKVSVGIRKK